MTVAEVTHNALELSTSNRVFLAHVLLRTLDEEQEEGLLSTWREELRERRSAIERGEMQPIAMDEAIADLRSKLAACRARNSSSCS